MAAALAGCGGDGEPAAPAPAKQQFIERADAACTKAREDLTALGREAATPPGLDKLAVRLDRLAQEIRAARPPAEDRATIEQYTEGLGRVADALRELADVSRDGEGRKNQARRAGKKVQRLGVESSRQAQEYGFEVCGRARAG